MSRTPDLSALYREAVCAVCGSDLRIRVESQPPDLCFEHAHQEGQTMSRKPKKDFSEAVAASAEPTETNGSTHPAPPLQGADRERIERKKYKEKLPCAIAPEIVVMRADELAKAWREIEELKIEQREHNAEFREKRAHLDKKCGELATSVEQHTEVRDVEVIEYLVAGTGTLEVVRQDTMEVFSTKTAGADDLQETIFGKTAKTVKDPEPKLFDDDEDDADDAAGAAWTEGANPKPVDATP